MSDWCKPPMVKFADCTCTLDLKKTDNDKLDQCQTKPKTPRKLEGLHWIYRVHISCSICKAIAQTTNWMTLSIMLFKW